VQKKDTKKKEKKQPSFFLWFLGEIDRVSLSLALSLETLSSPSSSSSSSSRRHGGAIIVLSSVGTVASSWGSPPFFDPGESASSSSSSSKIQNASRERIEKSYRVLDPNNNTRKTKNAGRPSFETAKTTTTLKNTNDDYDMLYSNTLCLNCAFVAANCVVADETANMVFGICDDDDDARWRSKKKRRFCLG